MYTIDELLFYIDYWIDHAYTLKGFLNYTFITDEDKKELIKHIEISKQMVFKYIRFLINEID